MALRKKLHTALKVSWHARKWILRWARQLVGRAAAKVGGYYDDELVDGRWAVDGSCYEWLLPTLPESIIQSHFMTLSVSCCFPVAFPNMLICTRA